MLEGCCRFLAASACERRAFALRRASSRRRTCSGVISGWSRRALDGGVEGRGGAVVDAMMQAEKDKMLCNENGEQVTVRG